MKRFFKRFFKRVFEKEFLRKVFWCAKKVVEMVLVKLEERKGGREGGGRDRSLYLEWLLSAACSRHSLVCAERAVFTKIRQDHGALLEYQTATIRIRAAQFFFHRSFLIR